MGYGTEGNGSRNRTLFDPAKLPLRSNTSYNASYARLEDLRNASTAQSAIDRERTDSGVNFRPFLSTISSVSLPDSIPLDTMHLIYLNVVSRILHLYTGTEPCCRRATMEAAGATEGTRLYSFILKETSLACIDESFNLQSPTCIFRTIPKDFARVCLPFQSFKQWKAIVGKEFILYYGIPLLYGHLPSKHLKGWVLFRNVTELLNRTVLTETDLTEIELLSIEFVRYLETEVTFHRPERAQVMRLVVHLLLHVGYSTRNCGPLVNLSQFWLERLIGPLTERLQAKSKPATSMTRSALHRLAMVINFPERLLVREEDPAHAAKAYALADETAGGRIDAVSMFRSNRDSPLLLSGRHDFNLHDGTTSRREDLRLLSKYLRTLYDDDMFGTRCGQGERLNSVSATSVVSRAFAKAFDRMLLDDGGDPADSIRTSRSALYANSAATRPDFYVAVGEHEAATNGQPPRSTYAYGKLLQLVVVRTPMCTHSNSPCSQKTEEHVLALIQPARRLLFDKDSDIVYTKATVESAFLTPRYVDVGMITHKIGIIQAAARGSTSQWTYFVDPQRTRLGMLGGRPCAGESGDHTLQMSW